jgi:hypothetical protein
MPRDSKLQKLFFEKNHQETFALGAALLCFAIIVASGALAGLMPPAWQGNWTDHIVARQAHFVDRFFPFDAVWYQRIATDFYAWDPTRPDQKQDVAFFPLWPIFLRVVAIWLPAAAARWAVVLLAGCFACAAVLAFQRLAARLLRPPAARLATLLFALWPGASFVLLSYPTGLMNLLCILAIIALMDRKFWRAALYAGLVTGAGPLGIGTSLAVCTCAAQEAFQAVATSNRSRIVEAFRLCGIALLSVSGLLTFLAWQYRKFGDPFAFITAQYAWAVPLPWKQRIPRALLQLLVLPEFLSALHELGRIAKATTRFAAYAALERSLNNAVQGAELIALMASIRLRAPPLFLQGIFTMTLFIWFDSASRPGHATFRLSYCSIAIFCGAAWLMQNHTRVATLAVCASVALLAGGAFLCAAGYLVV